MTTLTAASKTSKGMIWTGRVLSTLVVLFMLMDGTMKLIKIQPVIDATVKLGYPESSIRGIGMAALGAAILYAIPQTAVLGAILLTGFFGGAVATHIRADQPAFNSIFVITFGVIAWLGLFLRDARLRALIPFRSL